MQAIRPSACETMWSVVLQQGWTDPLRTLNPGLPIHTFWNHLRNAYGRDAGLRIDHPLLSPPLAERVVDARVDARHAPDGTRLR